MECIPYLGVAPVRSWLVGRCADAGPTEFAPRGGDGVHSVLSPLDAATAQGSEALSLSLSSKVSTCQNC